MTSNEALSRSQGRGQISDDQAGTTAQPSLCQSDHARAEVTRHGLGSVLHEPFHVDARPAAGIENAPASDGRQKSHPSTMAARRLESNIGGVSALPDGRMALRQYNDQSGRSIQRAELCRPALGYPVHEYHKL